MVYYQTADGYEYSWEHGGGDLLIPGLGDWMVSRICFVRATGWELEYIMTEFVGIRKAVHTGRVGIWVGDDAAFIMANFYLTFGGPD